MKWPWKEMWLSYALGLPFLAAWLAVVHFARLPIWMLPVGGLICGLVANEAARRMLRKRASR